MMKNYLFIYSILAPILFYPTLSFSENKNISSYNETFDTIKVGKLPAGWQINETSSSSWFNNNDSGKLANWMVMKDSNAPSGKNILAISKINKFASSVFNIIHTSKMKLKNGEISVRIQAKSGEIDQGGGPIWRFKDKNNYYVSRYNPLEQNFRIYSVKDGNRVQLRSAENIDIKQGEWFTIKIKFTNTSFTGWLNGGKLLSVKDNTHNTAGGVGLWTKADAITAFDNFNVSTK